MTDKQNSSKVRTTYNEVHLSDEEIKRREEEGYHRIQILNYAKWLKPKQEKFCQLLAKLVKEREFTHHRAKHVKINRRDIVDCLIEAGYCSKSKDKYNACRVYSYYILQDNTHANWIHVRLAELGVVLDD